MSGSDSDTPSAVVVGAGPGIGRAVAARFAREGYALALISRDPATTAATAATLGEFDVPVLELVADAADDDALGAALARARDAHGTPDVLVYNVGWIREDAPDGLDADGHRRAYAVNVLGALAAAVHTAPSMVAAGGGTVLLTGGMPEPDAGLTSLSLGKAALRTLVTLLDQRYGPDGVHVATVTVGGPVAPGTDYDPDDIAERYWQLAQQPAGAWEAHVRHG